MTQPCKTCGGYGYARAGICWSCGGAGTQPIDERALSLAVQEPPEQPQSVEAHLAHARYEYVRKLTPRQFSELWTANINGQGAFDDLVDAARPLQSASKGSAMSTPKDFAAEAVDEITGAMLRRQQKAHMPECLRVLPPKKRVKVPASERARRAGMVEALEALMRDLQTHPSRNGHSASWAPAWSAAVSVVERHFLAAKDMKSSKEAP